MIASEMQKWANSFNRKQITFLMIFTQLRLSHNCLTYHLRLVCPMLQISRHLRGNRTVFFRRSRYNFIGGAKTWLDLSIEENVCHGMVICLFADVVTLKL